MTPPALPLGVRLTSIEQAILNQLSTSVGIPAGQIAVFDQRSKAKALAHLAQLGQISVGSVVTPSGVPQTTFMRVP